MSDTNDNVVPSTNPVATPTPVDGTQPPVNASPSSDPAVTPAKPVDPIVSDILQEVSTAQTAPADATAATPKPAAQQSLVDDGSITDAELLSLGDDVEGVQPTLPTDPNNVSEFINMLLGDPELLTKLVERYYEKQPPSVFKSEVKDPKSLFTLARHLYSTTEQNITSQQMQITRMLKSIADKLEPSTASELPDRSLREAKGLTGQVTGKAAQLSVIAMLTGLKRVYLMNSGFWVTIRPFTISELNAFFSTVDLEQQDVGHYLGSVFFSFVDFHLREKFMDLFVSAVESSNLTGWDNRETLLNNISYNDYDTCVWAVCTLMYAQGVAMTMYCANPDCKYRNDNFQVDLNELRMNFFPETLDRTEMYKLLQKKAVTQEELATWRNAATFVRELTFDTVGSSAKMRYTLRVPTVAEYLAAGKDLLGKVAASLGKNTSIRSEQCRVELLLNAYRMFIAWVKTYSVVKDDKVTWWTEDRDAILFSLESSVHEHTSFYEDVIKFITDSRISYIAYRGVQCPNCHTTVAPNASIKDVVPIDVHALFFGLICRQQRQVMTSSMKK